MGNTNPYAGKPILGRDICRLMRDVNSVEATLGYDQGHTSSISSMAFSPDGTKILTGSYDGTAKLWNAATGTLIFTFANDMYSVMSVAFSPDGTRVLVGSSANSPSMWNAVTGARITGFTAGSYGLSEYVAFSSDGAYVFAGGGSIVKMLNADTGSVVWTSSYHTDSISSLCLIPDGTKVLTGSYDGTAISQVAATGALIRTYDSAVSGDIPLSSVARARFGPDGAKVLLARGDGIVKLWNTETGTLLLSFTGIMISDGGVLTPDVIFDAAFSPDGTKVLLGQSLIGVEDITAGTQDPAMMLNPRGYISSLMFNPDGTRLLSGTMDGHVMLSSYPECDPIQGFAPISIPQTTFYGYSETTKTTLGTPDGGVTIPTDAALDSIPLVFQNLLQVNGAIGYIIRCGILRCPETGQTYNLIDDNPSNLYFRAMGDRTKYGATGGPRYTWTRPASSAIGTPPVDIDIGELYECVELLKTAAGV